MVCCFIVFIGRLHWEGPLSSRNIPNNFCWRHQVASRHLGTAETSSGQSVVHRARVVSPCQTPVFFQLLTSHCFFYFKVFLQLGASNNYVSLQAYIFMPQMHYVFNRSFVAYCACFCVLCFSMFWWSYFQWLATLFQDRHSLLQVRKLRPFFIGFDFQLF